MSAGAHGRGQLQQIVIGADGDGRIVAASIDIMGDLGAYPHYGAYVPLFTGTVLSGPYAIEHLSTRIRGILTNRAPTCPYRGAGRPEAAFLLERTMDDLAAEMGTDPADLRRRNFIAPDAFPYHSPTGAVYDSGNYERMLADALETVGYADLRQQQAASPVIAGRALGVGLGAFVERSGGAVGSSEVGAIEVTADGEVICLSGSMSSGQEHVTSFSQVVADVLEVPLGRISVIEGDTGRIRLGTGTFASRSMQVGGSALHQAAKTIRQQALERVAAMLEMHVEDLKYAGGFVEVADASVEPMSLASVVAQTGPLQTESTFVSDQAFPSGVYAAVVEVDIETGEIFVDRIVAVDDCGIVVNPRIVHGQVVGSTVQGLGQALFEEILYDEHGQLMSGSLASYLLPTALTTPDVISLLAPTTSPVSPLGSKGAGEGGCIGAPAALLNAIQDALRRAGSGADISLPATPYKTWEALRR
jgi:carbon-monoxide dehydrogenase large subunit